MFPLASAGAVHVKDSAVFHAPLVCVTAWFPCNIEQLNEMVIQSGCFNFSVFVVWTYVVLLVLSHKNRCQ